MAAQCYDSHVPRSNHDLPGHPLLGTTTVQTPWRPQTHPGVNGKSIATRNWVDANGSDQRRSTNLRGVTALLSLTIIDLSINCIPTIKSLSINWIINQIIHHISPLYSNYLCYLSQIPRFLVVTYPLWLLKSPTTHFSWIYPHSSFNWAPRLAVAHAIKTAAPILQRRWNDLNPVATSGHGRCKPQSMLQCSAMLRYLLWCILVSWYTLYIYVYTYMYMYVSIYIYVRM